MTARLERPRLGARLIDALLSEIDADEYSCFKHGQSSVAAGYAEEIFESVLSGELVKNRRYVIVLSPSTFLPTASHSIGIALDNLMRVKGYATKLGKIGRNCTYTADYGMMNAEDRLSMIQADNFHLEEQFLAEEELLMVDDVSISGAHQYVVEAMLQRYDVKNRVRFLYYGVPANSEIDSRIESVMNNARVKCIYDLLELMRRPDFVLNTRVVKMILSSEELGEEWYAQVSAEIIENVITGAYGNRYDEIPEYVRNLSTLEALRNRGARFG